MIELDAICREAKRRESETLVLATVVRVEGSSYRRPGAHMLVDASQSLAGCVSGGCLEDDLVRRADFRLGRRNAVLVRYDSMSEDDVAWGLGVGCNGVVEVLLERLDGRATDPVRFASECFENEEYGVIATVFSSPSAGVPTGARLLVRRGRAEASDIDMNDDLYGMLLSASIELLASHGPRIAHVSHGNVETVLERVEPVPRVFVVGSRHDARPVVTLTRAMGFRTTVVDAFDSVSLRERFLDADQIAVVPPDELASLVDRHRTAHAVLMTHDYERDRSYLRGLLESRARYIGVLGPERRTARMLAELEAAGFDCGHHDLGRLHAPIGLDLCAETPAEIALAIVAEIQADITGSSGGRLRGRGPIHVDGLERRCPAVPSIAASAE